MCKECGCGAADQHGLHRHDGVRVDATPRRPAPDVVKLTTQLLAANQRQAAHNREHFDRHGVLAINLTSSPGAGKTALLEATIDALRSVFSLAVIEGDLETDNDAARIRARGVPAVQVTTGTACHLDAAMVHDALHHLDLDGVDVLFIENVGNLVCPASFDLGQHRNVTLLSATEGDDKPAKYPVMFRGSDLVLLTKMDLLPHLDDFSPSRAGAALRASGFAGPTFATSTRRTDGVGAWTDWLRQTLTELRAARRGSGDVETDVPSLVGPAPADGRSP